MVVVVCPKNQSAIWQMARILWLNGFSESNIMAMLHVAYFDASGENIPDYTVLAVGGAAAPVKKWDRFKKDWDETLKAHRLSEFHYTDFATYQGEFKEGWRDKQKRSRFLAMLKEIIKRNTNNFFMASVELDAWNEVNREYLLEEDFYSPYALCAYEVVSQVLMWARSKRIRNSLQFIFEEGDDGWSGVLKLCKKIGVVPVRLPKEQAIPCQLADWIAWKNRIANTNALAKLSTTPKHIYPDRAVIKEMLKEWESLENVLVKPGNPVFFGRDALLDSCKASHIPKRSAKLNILSRLAP
jgi:hypothetical protein